MSTFEETSENLAERLVAKITDELRTGAIGPQNYREIMTNAYQLAATTSNFLKLAKKVRLEEEKMRRSRLKLATELTAAEIAADNDAAAQLAQAGQKMPVVNDVPEITGNALVSP